MTTKQTTESLADRYNCDQLPDGPEGANNGCTLRADGTCGFCGWAACPCGAPVRDVGAACETCFYAALNAAVDALVRASLQRHLFCETVRRNVLEQRIRHDRKRFKGGR